MLTENNRNKGGREILFIVRKDDAGFYNYIHSIIRVLKYYRLLPVEFLTHFTLKTPMNQTFKE